jgi:hypothetical protein
MDARELKKLKAEVIQLIKESGYKGEEVPAEVKDDKDVVLAAVNMKGMWLEHANANLKKDILKVYNKQKLEL